MLLSPEQGLSVLAVSCCFQITDLLKVQKSHRWEVLVQVEGKRVEFFTPRIALECSELVPPVLPPVLAHSGVFSFECIVQEVCHNARHKCFR